MTFAYCLGALSGALVVLVLLRWAVRERRPRERRLQLVWWGWSCCHLGFKRLRREQTDLAMIYLWCLWLGPLEVRRWAVRRKR